MTVSNFNKTKRMIAVEAKHREPLETLIPRLFIQHGNLVDVAHDLGINRSVVDIWIMKLGLEIQRTIGMRRY